MTRHRAFNVLTGRTMCAGRFVVVANSASNVTNSVIVSVMNNLFSCTANQHISRVFPRLFLRVATTCAVFCADTPSTHTRGEDA